MMANFLGDHHRMFIQALMWKNILNSQEVISLHRKCHEKNQVQMTDLKPFVETINCSLRPLCMGIVKGVDELTGDQYYILINEIDNSLSRLSTAYKPNELELFKKVVSCIIESNEGKVLSTSILNLSNSLHTSKKDIDNIITKFSQDGWLNENGGYIYFSTRAIAELQHFFKENFADAISLCHLCKNAVFQGSWCDACGCKLHHHCKNNYFSEVRHRNCPSCKNVWTNN